MDATEDEDPCEDDCEWIAIPNGPANQVLLMPCIEGWPPPPPPPPPPPQTSNLAPYVPPIPGGNGWLQPIKPSCDSPNVQSGSRLHAWCVFAKVTELSNIGLPKWESSIPLQALDNPNGPAQLGHPSDRPVGQKRTMYSTDAWSDAWNGGYLTPCAGAARLAYCNNGNKDWMPPFRQTAYVYKGFWVPESKLPENADPDEIYSYQPPTGPRQYLVGLHINIGTGATINYWTWATFWISRNGDIRSKDGENLAQVYNPACTVGNQANMPGDVEGIWANYHMCVNDDPGEPPCGNPWGPTNECAATTCRECHVGFSVKTDEALIGEQVHAWLLSITKAGGGSGVLRRHPGRHEQRPDPLRQPHAPRVPVAPARVAIQAISMSRNIAAYS